MRRRSLAASLGSTAASNAAYRFCSFVSTRASQSLVCSSLSISICELALHGRGEAMGEPAPLRGFCAGVEDLRHDHRVVDDADVYIKRVLDPLALEDGVVRYELVVFGQLLPDREARAPV